jgi:60 kDa SS-A/Ro ribonucleoprotein
MSYLKSHGTRSTPQSQRIAPEQELNEAGGYVWKLDSWTRLRRFLILGSEGGSYYASEWDATKANVENLRACIRKDGVQTVQEIVEISRNGRAAKNDPALYALAACISLGDKATKSAAAEALPAVARIGTHLYNFVAFAETMRGWGRTMRWAVQNWYDKNPEQLAYQAIKYRQRDGWSHRDLLRLAHPEKSQNAAIFDWITHGKTDVRFDAPGFDMIGGFEQAQRSTSPSQTADLIRKYRLPREALLTEHLNSKEVWAALLETDMPIWAMLRNLATMTRNGILDSPEYRKLVHSAFTDQEKITKSRLHPITILLGMDMYARGHGLRGGNTWTAHRDIVDVLDGAFYMAFGNVTRTGKRILVAVDASGSMRGGMIAGAQGLTPVKAASAMALVTIAVEPFAETIYFDTSVSAFPLSARQRLDDVIRRHPGHGRGTDLALPYHWAKQNKKQYDAFITISDMQTWAGRSHPAQSLNAYRQWSGIQNARAVSIAMVANAWGVNDPADGLAFEAIGFDPATPDLVAGFINGEF